MGRPRLTNEQFDHKITGRQLVRLTNYTGPYEPMTFQCLKCNNIWTICADTIRSSGCPNCAGNKKIDNTYIDKRLVGLTIERLEDVVSSMFPISWKCKKPSCGCIWKTSPNCIVNHGTGCPRCAGKENLTEDIVKAKTKGRTLDLVGPITASAIKTKWKCKIDGHEWMATPNSILAGHGCPLCAENPKLNETLTGELIKDMFPNESLLKNFMLKEKIVIGNEVIKSKLFIDYVLPSMKIFVEYNGRQHYQPIKRFGGIEEFRKTKIRDQWLVSYCQQNGIKLITIDGRKYRGLSIKAFLKMEML